ncbi:hypothetical protein [Streptomyces sp. NPDC023838]|uniref:hypothetical protein n=1 Tax=Streptomyces sp. NPDC023838 TaxID=3154325 RepID=UPI0033C2F50F
MSTVTFTPAPTVPSPRGATATGAEHSPHRVGNALRAAKAFAGAALSVVVLGEYSEEAGVRRRHH